LKLVTANQHCHGYANCCECRICSARSEGVKAGVLVYDRHSQLRWKGNTALANGQAVVAYMRSRKQIALRQAA
jgi:hypothetical protein